MTVKWIEAVNRHARTFDKVMTMLTLGLFVYALADWLGWLPVERGFQPLRMVVLTGGLLLQPAAALVKRRSLLLHFVLIGASFALLIATVFVDG